MLRIPLYTAENTAPFYRDRNILPPVRDFSYLPPEKPRKTSKRSAKAALNKLIANQQEDFVNSLLK